MNKHLKQGCTITITLPNDKTITIEYLEMEERYYVETAEITQKFLTFAEVERFLEQYRQIQ